MGISLDYTNLSSTGIFIFFTAFIIGIKFSDWDFKMKLRHRNILTHSPLILILFQWLYLKNPTDEFRYFALGSSLGIGIHLIFDLFPKGWGGGSLLQAPIVKYSFSKRKTQILFIVFILISLGISIKNTKTIEEILLCVIFGTIIISLNAKKEEKLMRPLILYNVTLIGISNFKYPEVSKVLMFVYDLIESIISKNI